MHQELVGIRCGLVVASPKPVAHLGVKFRDGQQGIGHFRGSRRNHRDAAITRDHLFVIRERAFFGRLAVQRRALLFGPRKLRGSGLAFH